MRVGALRLLYQQSSTERLPEQQVLSLKRIVESAYDDDPDDWTVEMGDDDRTPATPLPVRNGRNTTEKIVADAKTVAPAGSESRNEDSAPTSGTGSSSSGSPAVLVPGKILGGRFVLGELLGTGGTGLVYRATDQLRVSSSAAKKEVALKILRSEFRDDQPRIAALRHEASISQSLSHPNIVRVYDFHEDAETRFLTMELLEGDLLRTLLKSTQSSVLARERATKIIMGLCQGLAHVHANGFVHGDFKPGNVFLTVADEPKILDFGLACLASRGAWPGGAIPESGSSTSRANTPAYASCNRLSGGDPVFSDDLFSLSCVIYELLSGHHPYQRLPATTAREQGLQPSRIDGLTDLQWRTLAMGLQLSTTHGTLQAHDFLAAFSETGSPELSPIPKAENRSRAWGRLVVFALLAGAVGLTALALLGIQPIDQRYIEMIRESKIVEVMRSIPGMPGDTADRPDATQQKDALEESAAGPSIEMTGPETGLIADETEVVPSEAGALSTTAAVGGIRESDDLSGDPHDGTELLSGQSPALAAEESLLASGIPGFRLDSAAYSIDEGAAALAVEIRRQGSVENPINLRVMTLDGSAKADIDFVSLFDYELRFEAGEESRTIFIPIVGDALPEGDELFEIALGTTNAEMILAEPSSATVTIVDDDA